MIKIIIADMDGTLLDDKKQLPPNFIDVYQQLERHDVMFVIASGRPIYSLKQEFSHFKNNITYIADNGAYIFHNTKAIIVDYLLIKDVIPLIDRVKYDSTLNVIICTEEKAYIENKTEDFFNTAFKYYKKLEVIDDLKSVDAKIFKVAIHNTGQDMDSKLSYFKEFESVFNCSLSGQHWLDIMPMGVSKGVAVEKLQESLQVTSDETMVFGDYLNDIEMLKVAKYSYAMDNGHPEVKKIANYIAPNNKEFGVIKVISEEVLQKL